MSEALVLFMPSGRRGRFKIGTPVLEAARTLGVYIESVCGGRGICGRCQVRATEGVFAKYAIESRLEHLSAPGAVEQHCAAVRALADDRRLSCQAKILGDLVIDVPADAAIAKQVVRKRAEARVIARDLAMHLHYVEVPPPQMDKPLGDLDRLIAALKHDFDLPDLACDSVLLPRVQNVLRQGEFKVTAVVYTDEGAAPRLIDIRPGYSEALFGVAVDIGSTTIACHLVDLMSGRTVASAGMPNPQIRFGEDLMSRVSYTMLNADGCAALTGAVRSAVQSLIERVAGTAGLRRTDVLEAVFVGNPIMHHLFLGIDPKELGQAPFALAVSAALRFPAREIGLELHPGARVYVLPCVAGHVGADAAGVVLSEAPTSASEVTLIVDVGTNAEIVLGTSEKLYAASSPTGPAFEGAEIGCGQRAAPGAIERVRIDPLTLAPRFKVIGCDVWSHEAAFAAGTETIGVTGLCGSGIIEAIGEMFLAGIVTADGVIDPALTAKSSHVVLEGRTASYVLWRGQPEIRVTQKDVRAIQLAKAALYAGCRLLMDKMGVARVDRIKLAGAFGSYIDPKYALAIGLVPDCDLAKVSAVGNAAGTGARMALLNRGHRREIEATVRRIEKIETAVEPRFQEHFVNAMALPNKVELFPCLERTVALPQRPPSNADGRRPRRRT
ncbi:MAG: ASKHA domain-containing protein [Hyphomicrobiaceae bacterium]